MELTRPPIDSMWKCPCGVTMPYGRILGHRKGWKKRPECKGKIQPLDPKYLWGTKETDEATPPTEPSPALSEESADVGIEDIIEDEDLDPEEIARLLNDRRGNMADAVLLDRDIMQIDGPPPNLPEGDWSVDGGQGPVPPSEERLAVTLPVQVRIIYDWARSQGWQWGDGSMSAFVTDLIFDHFNHCWGMAIFVAPIGDISDGESRSQLAGLTPEGAGPHAQAKR